MFAQNPPPRDPDADALDRQEQHLDVAWQSRDDAIDAALHDLRVDPDGQMRPMLLHRADRRDHDDALPVESCEFAGGEVDPEG